MNGEALVDLPRFLQATRHSGYRRTDAAIAELVDNALQAGAVTVEVAVVDAETARDSAAIWVLDDGCGMSRRELARALQFGGSSRFDDRTGSGRFGMGLPNASLSQARRVDVYTWRSRGSVWHASLDIDEALATIPPPVRKNLPRWLPAPVSQHGTLVVWHRLDRLEPASTRTIAKILPRRLGQTFRYALWGPAHILVNGKDIEPFDPLLLHPPTFLQPLAAKPYGSPLEYDATSPKTGTRSTIRVRFSEVPMSEVAELPDWARRASGISDGAGISVVRGTREIDYGWLLVGRRRERYDNWWRCEIQFQPDLDELFGVTHTKQGVKPTEYLRALLRDDLSAVAQTLNRRARTAHADASTGRERNRAALLAQQNDHLLRPLERHRRGRGSPGQALSLLGSATRYRLTVGSLDSPAFYGAKDRGGEVVVTVNCMHQFYHEVYCNVTGGTGHGDGRQRVPLELILLALGRAELADWDEQERAAIRRFISEWSRALSIFLPQRARCNEM